MKSKDPVDESSSFNKEHRDSLKREEPWERIPESEGRLRRSQRSSAQTRDNGEEGEASNDGGRPSRSRRQLDLSRRMKFEKTPNSTLVSCNRLEDVETVKKNGGKLGAGQAMAYLELMGNEMTRNVNKERPPILKKDGSAKSSSEKKSVKFAVNPQGRAWCLTRTFRKEPRSKKDIIWFSEEEMKQRQEEDAETVEEEEEEYGEALEAAYRSARKSGSKGTYQNVVLSFSTFAGCGAARGLEADIFPSIGKIGDKYRKAVIAAQKMVREERDKSDCDNSDSEDGEKQFMNEADAKIIRLQAVKHSRASRLVAEKFGAYDHQMMKNLALTDSLYDDDDTEFGSSHLDSSSAFDV